MDLLCGNYVLLPDVLNVDMADMGQGSPRHERIAAGETPGEASELAAEIVRELEERGVPSGAWLVDIARVRQSLREADTLLRRLEDAIIRSSSAGPLDEL
jgi:hypothetical protein